MIDLLSVLVLLQVSEYLVAYQTVHHILKHTVELAGKQSFLTAFPWTDRFGFVEKSIQKLPEVNQLILEVPAANWAQQAASSSGLNQRIDSWWLYQLVIEIRVDRKEETCSEIFKDRIKEDNKFLVVIDWFAAVSKFGVERLIVLDYRLDLADGLAPMDPVVAAGIYDRDVCEQARVLLVKIKQGENRVQKSLRIHAFVWVHATDGGTPDDLAARVTFGVFVDGSVNPRGKPEQDPIQPVRFQRIMLRNYFNHIVYRVLAESDFQQSLFIIDLTVTLK